MRLDEYLLKKQLAQNLKESQGYILSGKVLLNDVVADKCGFPVKKNDIVRLKNIRRFASRAAEKILPFIIDSKFEISQKSFIDIGASTGGFTSLLLQHKAQKVIALDVAYGLLDNSLRSHPHVHVMERMNICKLRKEQLPFIPSAFVMDVSFISLRKVLPCLLNLFTVFEGLILLKPQFELEFSRLYEEEKKDKNKFSGGVLRDENLRKQIIADFRLFLQENNIKIYGEGNAALQGGKGNLEYIFWVART